MAYQVLFQKLAFQRTKDGEPTIPVGRETIVERGGLVPEWVPTYHVSALFNAGMIVEVADEPRSDLVPATTVPEQPRTPDQPAVLPSNPNSVPMVPGAGAVDGTDDEPADPLTPPPPDSAGVEPLPALPRPADNKETWENYAQRPQIGMSEGEAEAMNKTDLMAEVKKRYDAATK